MLHESEEETEQIKFYNKNKLVSPLNSTFLFNRFIMIFYVINDFVVFVPIVFL